MVVSYTGSFIGHVVLIYGYNSDGDVYIYDPFYGPFVVPYGTSLFYNNGSGYLTWGSTIVTHK